MDTSRNIELHNDSPEFKLYYDLNNPRRKLITKGSYLQELGWIYEKSSYGTPAGLRPLECHDRAMMLREEIEQLGYHIYTQPRIMHAAKTSF